jgi:hypothetical protein
VNLRRGYAGQQEEPKTQNSVHSFTSWDWEAR